jgi:predicted MPP superfamily phosphohydrolase
LVQLSDIHFNSYMTREHLRAIVEITNAQRPDLAVFTGDYVTQASHNTFPDKHAEYAWPCAEVLRGIRAPLGRVAVLGNHDCATNPDIVAAAMSANNIQVLRNRSIPLERNGKRLWLVGVDDVVEQYARADLALKGVPPDECVLAVVHEPDFADEMRKRPVDFQLSGHSHGGQVRFPIVGALYLPELAKKYPLGYYRFGSFQLYTNRGVGVIGLPLRFMCPPEITVFTLRSG